MFQLLLLTSVSPNTPNLKPSCSLTPVCLDPDPCQALSRPFPRLISAH